MHDRKFEIIQQLMDELKGEMEYDEDDFSERLGRKKPDVAVVSVEGDMSMPEDEMDMMEESPEDQLKSRLMKLRGA